MVEVAEFAGACVASTFGSELGVLVVSSVLEATFAFTTTVRVDVAVIPLASATT